MENHSQKPLDQVRDAIPIKHYTHSIEQSYVYWIKKSISFSTINALQRNGPKRSPVF
jgi:hypothetical protein